MPPSPDILDFGIIPARPANLLGFFQALIDLDSPPKGRVAEKGQAEPFDGHKLDRGHSAIPPLSRLRVLALVRQSRQRLPHRGIEGAAVEKEVLADDEAGGGGA